MHGGLSHGSLPILEALALSIILRITLLARRSGPVGTIVLCVLACGYFDIFLGSGDGFYAWSVTLVNQLGMLCFLSIVSGMSMLLCPNKLLDVGRRMLNDR
jgi:hypothetical protein